VTKYEGVDDVVDLSKYPWKWDDESISGVYASHVLEHLDNEKQKQFILECHRILKKGGFLKLNLPHSSCVTALGCFGHYRTFAYSTMNDYLARDFYLFGKAKWKTIEQKLTWWYEVLDTQKELPMWIYYIIKVVNPIMNFIIRIVTPRIFENVFCPTIQCREVIYICEKI
jgi:ubiquinone/menaquinone biosynthesis C-methylase UbiE